MSYRNTEDAVRAERDALTAELRAYEHLDAAARLIGRRLRTRYRWRFVVLGAVLGLGVGSYAGWAYARRQAEATTVATALGDTFGDQKVRDAAIYSLPFAGATRIRNGWRSEHGFRVDFDGEPWTGAVQIARDHPWVESARLVLHNGGESSSLTVRFIEGPTPRFRVTAAHGLVRVFISRSR